MFTGTYLTFYDKQGLCFTMRMVWRDVSSVPASKKHPESISNKQASTTTACPSYRIFMKNFWQPFESNFGSIEQSFREHLKVLSLSNQVAHQEQTRLGFKTVNTKLDQVRKCLIIHKTHCVYD